MQVKGKHDRTLYFTWYIESTEINYIQVDLRSTLSIIPHQLMQSLGILSDWLSTTQTLIFGFNSSAHTHWGRSDSDAKTKWHAMSSTLRLLTAYCLDILIFTTMESFHPPSIRSWNMSITRVKYELSLQTNTHSKVSRTSSLTSCSIRIN